VTTDRTRTSSRSGSGKPATKKQAAKKQATKKQATKKSASKKQATRSSASRTRSGSAPRAEARPAPGGLELAAEAARQLGELTGRATEGVTALERTEDGWRVEVEVLELRRIPETTDVLATYVVTVDERGRLEGYQRHGRYVRGSAGEER
jgi:hypothetical protein